MDGEFLTSQSNHSIRGLMNPSIHCLLMHQNEVGTWVGWRQGFEKDDPSGVTRVWERWPFRCDVGFRKMTLQVWQGFGKDDPSGVTRVWERWPFSCDKGLRKMTLHGFRCDKGLRKITLQVWKGFEKDDPLGDKGLRKMTFWCDKGLRKMTFWMWQGFEKDDPSGVLTVCNSWQHRINSPLRLSLLFKGCDIRTPSGDTASHSDYNDPHRCQSECKKHF